MTKILILSDLHLELGKLPLEEDGRRIDEGVDVVVLAGDVMNGLGGPRWARKSLPGKKIVMVAGNHELYGQDWYDGIDLLREEADRHQINFLENEFVEIDGVRFLGCTLWTDFCVHGPELQAKRMIELPELMTDYKEIRCAGASLSAQAVLLRHQTSLVWLKGELEACDFDRTVVVTHHAPHLGSIERYDALKPVATAYASDLEELMGYAGHWIHGHVHEAADYEVHGTRIVCNPLGYPAPNGDSLSGWAPCFTLDI